MKKSLSFLWIACFWVIGLQAQEVYQTPAKEITDLLLAPPTPTISMDGMAQFMLIASRNSYPSVEELGQPEFKVAGLRMNPLNASITRQTYINHFALKEIATNKTIAINGLPVSLSALNPVWSPNEDKIAFLNVLQKSVDLYVIDIKTKQAKKINKGSVNTILGSDIVWLNNETLLYKVTANDLTRLQKKPITPKGPTIQENLGKVAPSVTYQDLIKSPYDEYVFEFLSASKLVKNTNGVETTILASSILASFQISPDKKYILTKQLNKPFSYLVTAYGFASTINIIDVNGKKVHTVANLPSGESTPSGYDNVQNVPRAFDWKNDAPATLIYAMPLDSGLIKKQVPFHDAVYSVNAPFNGTPVELFKTKYRYSRTIWGDNQLALVSENLRSKQQYRMSIYNANTNALDVFIEGNSTDAYHFPGTPVTHKNAMGEQVFSVSNNAILFNNTTGASAKGDLPYLAWMDIKSHQQQIVWRCGDDAFEYVAEVLQTAPFKVITRMETEKQVPNYFIRVGNTLAHANQITQFENPYKALEGVSKEKIKYTRKDGVALTGDLYLPKGYNKEKDGPLPTLIWAYPREFTSASDASQVRGNAHRFTMLSWGSPIFYVTQGYAILDNAEMPIVATSADKKPNDDFVNQLILNATAAIDQLANMGVGDRNRMAVGGHSYGAFMTANLLAHTNGLFKAGIARSGAYNRTLTPFGFQNEERTFWQAPDLYMGMSPFAFADKIKTPILLTHGVQDDNTGTFPINSERLFAAIKGHGGIVRFVYLPYEAHGYKGKENLLHLLWEQGRWLDTYVKKK